MKRILSTVLLSFILVSCGGSDVELQEKNSERTEFFIETTLGSEFASASNLEKVGQVSSSQDIILTSNTSGRVGNVGVKVGDSVAAGQVIAILEDNIGNLGINLERSNIAIERANINYESNEISLDKQIFDAKQRVDTLIRNLETARLDAQQNLLQAQDTVDNNNVNTIDSSSSLQLAQLDNNIEKAKLDYDIRLVSDAQQIKSYGADLRRDFNALTTFLDDVIDFSDNILGVTDVNRNENREFDQFLGVLDTQQKTISKGYLRELMSIRDGEIFSQQDLLLQQGDLNEDQILESITYINLKYEIIDDLLMALEQTLFNSTASVGELSEEEIDQFLSQINGFQSQSQSTYGAFISFGSSVETFLETYTNNQLSILKSIELQEKDREIQGMAIGSSGLTAVTSLERTRLSIEENISNLQAQVASAENDLEIALSNKNITLRSLQNSIQDANVGYASSVNDYNKLTIRSPINGTISQSYIDVGQEVFSGNNLFNIVSDSTPEVQVSFNAGERDLIKLGQEVSVMFDGNINLGTIYSISEIADDNLNYVSTIIFDSGVNIIGNIVNVSVPISTDKVLLPINIIETQGDDIGLVRTLSGSTISPVRIRLGEVFGAYIELVSCAKQCEDLKIITSDTSNYDENKFTIVER